MLYSKHQAQHGTFEIISCAHSENCAFDKTIFTINGQRGLLFQFWTPVNKTKFTINFTMGFVQKL